MRALGWSCLAIAEGTEIPSAMLTLESYEDCTTVARRDHAPVQEAYLVKSPSIFFIIRSAHWMLASMSLSVRGLPCGVPNRSSAVCMCRLARIAAMIPITRFRPSSMGWHQTVMRVEPHATLRKVDRSIALVSYFVRSSARRVRNAGFETEDRLRDKRTRSCTRSRFGYRVFTSILAVPAALLSC